MKGNYKPIPLGDTASLSETEWLHWRQHGPHWRTPDENDIKYLPLAFGGSDISAIFNLSPFKCSLELFYEKTGSKNRVAKLSNNDAKQLGHIYEEAVSEVFVYWYRKNHPKASIRKINDTQIYRHGALDSSGNLLYPWVLVNLDRLISINNVTAILEIKTTSPRNIKVISQWKAGVVPPYYNLQCRYYMAAMNIDLCYICCVWNIGLSEEDMAVIKLTRNHELEDCMMSEIQSFAECVEQNFCPSPALCNATLLNDFYSRLYGETNPYNKIIEIPPSYLPVVSEAISLEKQIDAQEEKLAALVEKKESALSPLYPLFKNTQKGFLEMPDKKICVINLKTPHKKDLLDTAALQNDFPGIYSSYETPVFNAALFKKENRRLANQYKIPGGPSDDPKKKNTFSLEIK